ncbi:MAG: extracellular solute-binding protein family 1 [Herbinix sp.]|jgi:putative aldouronate transport system substrate-binding protein|nr:extracellular solute-binding protein family 1 [Herbinix sp.]
MKNVRRKFCLILAVLLIAVIPMSACKKSTPTDGTAEPTPAASEDTTKTEEVAPADPIQEELAKGHVTLIGYQFGDNSVDHEAVLAKLNEKLEADINTTIELRGIPWTDAETKYKLMFASGEEFDFCYSGAWIGFNSVATTNGYMPIDLEKVKTFAPDTYAATSPDRWKQVTVKGNVYGLPNINAKIKNVLAVFRGDILDKYNITSVSSPDEFVNALLTIAAGEDELLAWNIGNAEQNGRMRGTLYSQAKNLKDVIAGVPFLSVDMLDDSYKIFKIYEDPDYLKYLETTQKLADAGVWSKSALSNADADENNFLAEKSACYIADAYDTFNRNDATMKALNETYANRYFEVNPGYKKIPEGGNMSMLSINANSKNAERVMMMFNLFETDKSYYDLINYGIEGTHYEAVGDTKFNALLPKYNDFGGFTVSWGTNNSNLIRQNATVPQEQIDAYNKSLAEDSIETPLATFTFDDTEYKNEIAAITNIVETYMIPIELGLTDQKEGLEKMKQKLEAADIDVLLEAVQTQLDAYVAEYNGNN